MPRHPATRARDYNQDPSTNRLGPKHVEPHSAWQKLVEKQRESTNQAIRDLATRAQIPAGTLFNWLRSAKGAPPRLSYTSNLNRRMAEALACSPEELAEAYNQSAFNPVDPDAIEAAPEPRAPSLGITPTAHEAVSGLLAKLRSTGRSQFTLSELELIAQLLVLDRPEDSQAT